MEFVLQAFLDDLELAGNLQQLRDVLTAFAVGLGLGSYAYLALANLPSGRPRLISNYDTRWTDHYLAQRYERRDPVILRSLHDPKPFEWGPNTVQPGYFGLGPQLFQRSRSLRHLCWIDDPNGSLVRRTRRANICRRLPQRNSERHPPLRGRTTDDRVQLPQTGPQPASPKLCHRRRVTQPASGSVPGMARERKDH